MFDYLCVNKLQNQIIKYKPTSLKLESNICYVILHIYKIKNTLR